MWLAFASSAGLLVDKTESPPTNSKAFIADRIFPEP
jgi:hypothetical protein